MPPEVRHRHNWDHPDSLDNELFLGHLDALRRGVAVEQPDYDFATHSRTGRTTRIEPRPVILTEGVLLFVLPEIRERLDLRVFVHTPAEERFIRRLERDTNERGRSISTVIEQFRDTVQPMHERFVEPSRVHAHLVIPWGHGPMNDPAVAVLESWIACVVGGASASGGVTSSVESPATS
jgi:uridine kinase